MVQSASSGDAISTGSLSFISLSIALLGGGFGSLNTETNDRGDHQVESLRFGSTSRGPQGASKGAQKPTPLSRTAKGETTTRPSHPVLTTSQTWIVQPTTPALAPSPTGTVSSSCAALAGTPAKIQETACWRRTGFTRCVTGCRPINSRPNNRCSPLW